MGPGTKRTGRYAPGYVRRRTAPARLYYIRRKDGRFLADTDVLPFQWSDRAGIAYRSYAAAERAIAKHFIGLQAAKEHGIRPVPV